MLFFRLIDQVQSTNFKIVSKSTKRDDWHFRLVVPLVNKQMNAIPLRIASNSTVLYEPGCTKPCLFAIAARVTKEMLAGRLDVSWNIIEGSWSCMIRQHQDERSKVQYATALSAFQEKSCAFLLPAVLDKWAPFISTQLLACGNQYKRLNKKGRRV